MRPTSYSDAVINFNLRIQKQWDHHSAIIMEQEEGKKNHLLSTWIRVQYIVQQMSAGWICTVFSFICILPTFPFNFHPLPEVSTIPVVFFFPRIKRGCRTRDLLLCLIKIIHMCVLAQLSIVFIFLVIILVIWGKMFTCFPKKCVSEKI